jgi:hypothetical protein
MPADPGELLSERDGIFDVQIAGRLAEAAADPFTLAGGVASGAVVALVRHVRHRSGQVEFAVAARVRARVHEVRARRRVQHDGLWRRRLGRLIAEREVDANRSEVRELHAQLLGSHAAATLLFAQEIPCPFRADRGEFHGVPGVLTTTVTAAATATAAGLVLGFVDLERATAEVLAVQRLHGLLGIGRRHFDEAETARTARLAIVHQRD